MSDVLKRLTAELVKLRSRVGALERREGSGGVADHGMLTGLGDDDHAQYLTTGRGDARYLGLTAKAADSDKLDGYHAGNSSGQVPVSNGAACANLNADLLDGNHASAFAAASDMADIRQSCSIEASSTWTIPTKWTDVPSMRRTINITQQCDLFIYAALNVAGGGPDWSQIHFRAFVDAVGMEIYTDQKAGTNPLLTCPHWYFGGVGAGSHTIKVQMQGEKSGNSLARRRLSVIVIPVN